jgi:hypothetical protein
MLAGLFLANLLAGSMGCGKHPTSPPSAIEPTAGQPAPSTAVPPAGSSAGAAGSAQNAVPLTELTQAVRKYSVEQRRVPKTLEELTTQGYLSAVPPAPVGKKFVITKNLQVDLVDR